MKLISILFVLVIVLIPNAQAAAAVDFGGALAEAWKHYNNQEYSEAARLFDFILEKGGDSDEARLGLGYSYVKLEKEDEALAIFEALYKKGYKRGDTLPALMDILIKRGEFAEAAKYLEAASHKSASKWKEAVEEGAFRQELNFARSGGGSPESGTLAARYRQRLLRCQEPDAFREAARALAVKGDRAGASEILKALLEGCRKDTGLRLGIFYELRGLIKPDEMLSLLDAELSIAPKAEGSYIGKLSELRLYVLQDVMSALPEGSDAEAESLRKILRERPDDPSALARMGWNLYKRGDYDGAIKAFERLLKLNPDDSSSALGKAFSLLRLSRYSEAYELAVKFESAHEDFGLIKKEVLLERGRAAYKALDYEKAAEAFGELLLKDPANSEARALSAWSLYNLGRKAEALPLFMDMHSENPDPQMAGIILVSLEEVGRRGEAYAFARTLAREGDIESRKTAAKFFDANGLPVTASGAYETPESCYLNADSAEIAAGISYKHKSGDEGVSMLDATEAVVGAETGAGLGGRIGFESRMKKLSSGDAGPGVFAGSFHAGPQIRDLNTEEEVSEHRLIYTREGYIEYGLSAGVAASGGPLGSYGIFDLSAGGRSWTVGFHRKPVEESILSYAGLIDPYADRKWGRVSRTGLNAGINRAFADGYSIALDAGYDEYEGVNVIDNSAYGAAASFGKSDFSEKGVFYKGIFVRYESFEKNASYYTYGHGGYFSPSAFFAAGPSVSFKGAPCESGLFEAEASVSYQSKKTDEAPHYPLGGVEGGGVYEADSESAMGYNIGIRWTGLIARSWQWNMGARAGKSSDYEEASAAAGLSYFFGERNSAMPQAYR